MIKEDYVNFEIAKLLKEKGFDCSSYSHYRLDNGELCRFNTNCSTNLEQNNYITAPTLQMAMKWLREVHGLFIGIDYVNIAGLGFTYQATILRKGEDYSYCLHKKHYEEACEDGIRYCLENLI